jgi:hypothetical protein
LIGFASNTFAQVIAQDDASSYSNAPANAAWLSGSITNGGFGFTPWVFQKAGPGFQGFYIGNPGSIGTTNGKAWGQYANEGGNQANIGNASVAFRGFSNSLATNTVFSIKWQNHGIGEFNANDSQRLGGFCLRNGNANGSTNDFNNGARFVFYYIGGGSDAFVIQDGNGNTPTSLGFGANPFTIEFTLLTTDTYRLVIKDAAGVNILAEYDDLPLEGTSGSTIDSVSTFAINTGGDQVWNNLRIFSASLTPPVIDNLQPSNGTIYASSATPFSFTVTSTFSTVTSNGVQLTLNGVVQTNLSFTGSGTTNLGATLNMSLQDNVLYNGTIVATDANGNHATNNFSFNTWLATDYFIEASDYNFSSGTWINAPQPNQDYAGLLGSNGIDYLEFDLSGTNNAYRPGDLPQIERATDIDHNGFASQALQPYNLAFIENGEWENYTRDLGNTNFLVYARMSGFGANPVMEMENLANPTATTSNQPLAALGTFVCPETGGPQDWTFVPLKDFFSQPVTVNFANTNTMRMTCVGSSGSINVAYLIFVPQTNGSTLRPYISAGFPFPGAVNAAPDGQIHFTIANRQSSVVPGSIQLSLNGNNVTGGISLNNNAAGTVVTYQPPTLLPPGTNTLQAIYSDGTIVQTNTWQFTVPTLPVLNPAWALPMSLGNGIADGFAVQIAKAADDSPSADFPPTIAEALAQLAGTLTNSLTSQPYVNIAPGPYGNGLYTETNSINYDITGAPTGSFTFNFKTNFPYVPANGTNNYISMAANMYLSLSAGVYTIAVRSDDGFLLTAGPTPTSTNLTLGVFDAGRGNGTPSQFDFIVQSNGIYPMRLIYDQGQFGGNIEFYSVNRTNGANTLINDQTNPDSIRSILISPMSISLQKAGGNLILNWTNTTFINLQGAAHVTGPYSNITVVGPYTNPIAGSSAFFQLTNSMRTGP